MFNTLQSALGEAIQDEYKARATYRAIIDRFGSVRPFVNILGSEERHIQALKSLYHRYNLPIPDDTEAANVVVPDTLTQACQEGVQAEIDNGVMYDRLLTLTVDFPDVQQVFHQLQRASQFNHLPAFQRCASRTHQSTQSFRPHPRRGRWASEHDVEQDAGNDQKVCHPANGSHQKRRRQRWGQQ